MYFKKALLFITKKKEFVKGKKKKFSSILHNIFVSNK